MRNCSVLPVHVCWHDLPCEIDGTPIPADLFKKLREMLDRPSFQCTVTVYCEDSVFVSYKKGGHARGLDLDLAILDAPELLDRLVSEVTRAVDLEVKDE